MEESGLMQAALALRPARSATESIKAAGAWAFEAIFDGKPGAPSQTALPATLDYAVTHRTHPGAHFETLGPFPADHSMSCAGPDPAVVPLPQHDVTTSNRSRGASPDRTFYICNDHLMTAMGDVEGYSVRIDFPPIRPTPIAARAG